MRSLHLALALTLISTTALASKPVVAVFEIEGKGIKLPRTLSQNLVQAIETRLAASGRFEVVPRSQIKRALRKQKAQSYQACYDEKCQIEIGKEVAAERSLAVRVLKIGKTCSVSLMLYDLRKSTAVDGKSLDGGCAPEAVYATVKKTLSALLGGESSSSNQAAIEREIAAAKAPSKNASRAQRRAHAARQWPAIKRYAQTSQIELHKRIERLKRFISDFGVDNPHRAQAEKLLGTMGESEPKALIPAGSFFMGCKSHKYRKYTCWSGDPEGKTVHVPAFYIDKTEVTVAQYRRCVDAGVCSADGVDKHKDCNWSHSNRSDHPMNCVNWSSAKLYCEWAGGRLPTKKEWEKAARGTDGRAFPWGRGGPSCSQGIFKTSRKLEGPSGCNKNSTWPVGSKPKGASPFGLLDTFGNVSEWTSDVAHSSERRTIKGASFRTSSRSSPSMFMLWKSSSAPSKAQFGSLGLRCAYPVKGR